MIRSLVRQPAVCLLLLTATSLGQAPPRRRHRSRRTRVVPGELVIEPPTLINLGFEWFIQGDANRNATRRRRLSQEGRDGVDARRCRCCGCRASASTPSRAIDLIAPNMFAGSVLDLEPDTAYDVRLTMADPDGVQGERSRIVTVSTRAGATAVCRRPRLSRLSARPHRSEDRAGVRRADVRVQLLVRGHRLGDVGPSARAGRVTRSSCTPASINTTATSTRTTPASTARCRSTARIT